MGEAEPPRTYGPKVWERPKPLGEPEAVRGLGATVAPLLSGFSLAAIATLVNADPTRRPPLTDFAIGAFAIAVALLLQAMQFAFMVLRYSAPVDARLNVNPWARRLTDDLEGEREVQWHDALAAGFYRQRVYRLYDLGLLAFLTGLLLLLIPRHWSAGRSMGLVMIAASTVIELLWVIGDPLRMRRVLPGFYRWLIPLRPEIVRRNQRRLDRGKEGWVKPRRRLAEEDLQALTDQAQPRRH
jgi:hypothetical protein